MSRTGWSDCTISRDGTDMSIPIGAVVDLHRVGEWIPIAPDWITFILNSTLNMGLLDWYRHPFFICCVNEKRAHFFSRRCYELLLYSELPFPLPLPFQGDVPFLSAWYGGSRKNASVSHWCFSFPRCCLEKGQRKQWSIAAWLKSVMYM